MPLRELETYRGDKQGSRVNEVKNFANFAVATYRMGLKFSNRVTGNINSFTVGLIVNPEHP